MDAKALAKTYFDSWKAKDFDTFRSILADNATFDGPLGKAANAEECVEGIRHMSEMVDEIVVRKMVGDDSDVITWFELHTKDGKIMPTANWSHVAEGKISKIQVTFDPRPITA